MLRIHTQYGTSESVISCTGSVLSVPSNAFISFCISCIFNLQLVYTIGMEHLHQQYPEIDKKKCAQGIRLIKDLRGFSVYATDAPCCDRVILEATYIRKKNRFYRTYAFVSLEHGVELALRDVLL